MQSLPIGNPLDEKTLIGPLIDEAAAALRWMTASSRSEPNKAGNVFGGGREE